MTDAKRREGSFSQNPVSANREPSARLQQPQGFKLFPVIFFALLTLLFFLGCDLYGTVGEDDISAPGELPALLRGTWAYTPPGSALPSDWYSIEKSPGEGGENDIVQYGYGGGESPTDYKGIICFVSNFSGDSGVIIIKYTEKPAYELYNGNSFFGVYYRNLKDSSVQIANAINLSDYSSPDTETLDEAAKKFTRRKMGNFVDWNKVQPYTRKEPR